MPHSYSNPGNLAWTCTCRNEPGQLVINQSCHDHAVADEGHHTHLHSGVKVLAYNKRKALALNGIGDICVAHGNVRERRDRP
jgi:hypothetical protein